MMRISIREQLALLFLLASLIGLGVISIATWVSNHSFVLNLRASRLALIASLKAAQLTSNLDLMQTTSQYVANRIAIQSALTRYNTAGNNSVENWSTSTQDMVAALAGGGPGGRPLMLQSIIYPKNASGPAGRYGLLNTTSDQISNITLPYSCPDGGQAYLGMESSHCGGLYYGYPPALYPNLTYSSTSLNDTFDIQQAGYNGEVIGPEANTAFLLGPWKVNETFSLVSITRPFINNTSDVDVLGWLTVIMDARLIQQVIESTEGVGETGETMLVGPANSTNHFANHIMYNTGNKNAPDDFLVQYVLPLNTSHSSRHSDRAIRTSHAPFRANHYPAILDAVTQRTGEQDNSGSLIRGHSEDGSKVSTGYGVPQTKLVNWIILVEQARSEVWQPIHRLRDILLACVFATAALMAIIAFPLAHFAVKPIRNLREATAKSVEPPGQTPSRSSMGSFDSVSEFRQRDGSDDATAGYAAVARKEGVKNPVSGWRQKRREEREARRAERRKRTFRIPGKVKERKVLVKDELSDLTKTFNEMSDELMMQYSKLEERVQQRTAELEMSKKAAESANESKTLFIANISHELKTPLNGILGMCAVCMQEDDPLRLKRSLGIIYKSGDLLLNLLTDLLTFSKNQVGQHLSLDEKDFRLRDVSSQVLAIFEKQAKESQVDLRVEWEGVQNLPNDNESINQMHLGPGGTGRLKDMILWGDIQRILQVVINLVSNSLKFTPAGGSVVLTIRCLPETYETASRHGSSASRASKQSRMLAARKYGSASTLSDPKMATANAINIHDRPNAIHAHEPAVPPPPGIYLTFEFEVTDTGPGISDDLQARIFEPFVQGDLGLSKKFGGTGLGLSICSQLASLMRGTIGVRSVVGSGSTFTMKIPIRHLKTRADSSASSRVDVSHEPGALSRQPSDDGERTPARHSRHITPDNNNAGDEKATVNTGTPTLSSESQPRLVGLSQPFFAASQPLESPGSQPAAMEKLAAEATRTGGKIRVLVAEDNQVNQEVVLRMLKLEDIYDVTVAKDGQEALDFVKASMDPTTLDGPENETKPYNLIFMDVQMPNVDGLQSTRLIREIGYQAPIVALTAFAEESNIKDCYDSGMNYFLSKPIRRPQLKKVLKEYCAPIPEENEDQTPPEIVNIGGQNTTVVMVNASGRNSTTEAPDGMRRISEEAPVIKPKERAEEIKRSESPVSPFSSG